jgi:hypothetical protein
MLFLVLLLELLLHFSVASQVSEKAMPQESCSL